MKESAREGLLVNGAGAPLAKEDSGTVELPDGTSVSYRAIAPDNASALQRFHHRLSDHSIYLRFFGAKPELSDRKAGYFTNVDGTNRFALVALDPEREGEIIAHRARELPDHVRDDDGGSFSRKAVCQNPPES